MAVLWQLMFSATVVTASAKTTSIPIDFPVPIESKTAVTVQSVTVGDTLYFAVAERVVKDGCLLFRQNAPVAVVVRRVEKPGLVGQPSALTLEVVWAVAADGQRIGLRGRIHAKGEDLQAESIGIAAAFCCLGVFLRGGEQSLGPGVGTLAFTRSAVDVPCASAKSNSVR